MDFYYGGAVRGGRTAAWMRMHELFKTGKLTYESAKEELINKEKLMNWWDNLSDEQIRLLKDNLAPFGLCPVARIMETVPHEVREIWHSECGWMPDPDNGCKRATIFRLNPDWQRPAPEAKSGRWESCEVVINCIDRDYPVWGFYRGDSEFNLNDAFSMLGFAGIEYAEWPGVIYRSFPMSQEISSGYPIRNTSLLRECERPAIPAKVWFYVERE